MTTSTIEEKTQAAVGSVAAKSASRGSESVRAFGQHLVDVAFVASHAIRGRDQ